MTKNNIRSDILGKYVPILNWKKGEQDALIYLSDDLKEFITPLAEIPPIDIDFQMGHKKKIWMNMLKNYLLQLTRL